LNLLFFVVDLSLYIVINYCC